MLTQEDYQQVIKDCINGLQQLEPDGDDCTICGGNDHQAFDCVNHNPVLLIKKAKRVIYRCYHCGLELTEENAEQHFGKRSDDSEGRRPVCYKH